MELRLQMETIMKENERQTKGIPHWPPDVNKQK